jgi:putative FmdB family regulatory protein
MLESNQSWTFWRDTRPAHTSFSMPIYEYQCKKCGHKFERIQRFSDPLVKKCPQCGGKVEQVISAPAVQFKGSGWYVTDYANKSSGASKSEPKSGSDGKGDSAKDSGTKKDSKPKAESASKSSEKK